jgi:predicted CoA-substrate-specific enzyme activase
MKVYMGIDVGSRTCKGVLLQGNDVLARHVEASASSYSVIAETVRDRLLEMAHLSSKEVARVVMTGMNSSASFGEEYVTDIQCCARGACELYPAVCTVIDVEAQTSQVLRVGSRGQVTNFMVSEKCAAGSGRFLDIVASILQIRTEDAGRLSLTSSNPVVFSTGCAVFGESEAISRVAEGTSKEDILAGVNHSLADKLGGLLGRVGMEEPCAFVGGGALNAGLVKSVELKLGVALLVPEYPQFITALGAAVTARDHARSEWGEDQG